MAWSTSSWMSRADPLVYILKLTTPQCLATLIIAATTWILLSSKYDRETQNIPHIPISNDIVILNCYYISSIISICSYSAAAKYWNPSLMIILYISPIITGSVFISADDPIPENLMLFLLIVEDILSEYTPLLILSILLLFCHLLCSVVCNEHRFNLLKDTRRNWLLLDFAGSKMPSSLKCQIADCKSKCYICC